MFNNNLGVGIYLADEATVPKTADAVGSIKSITGINSTTDTVETYDMTKTHGFVDLINTISKWSEIKIEVYKDNLTYTKAFSRYFNADPSKKRCAIGLCPAKRTDWTDVTDILFAGVMTSFSISDITKDTEQTFTIGYTPSGLPTTFTLATT